MPRRGTLAFRHGRGVGGITARALDSRGEDTAGRHYWRIDEYLGGGKRATVWTGWASPDDADRRAAAIYADREGARTAREARRREDEIRAAERGRTVAELVGRWLAAVEAEARETQDAEVEVATADGANVRLRRRIATAGRDGKRASRAIRSDATLRELRISARRIVRLVGERPVEDADGAAVALEAGVLAEAAARGRRPSQLVLDGLAARLHRAFRWGKANGLVARVPSLSGYAIDRRDPAAYAGEKWTPSRQQLDALLAAVDAVATPRQRWARPLVLLLACTGARIGDLAPARVGDVDLERGVLRLPRRKGGDSAQIALVPNVRMELAAWIGDRPADDLLFPPVLHRDATRTPRQIGRAAALSGRVASILRRAAAHEGIEHRVTAHALRRFVDNAVVNTAGRRTYQDLMGHDAAIGDASYGHADIDRQREALEAALGDLGGTGTDGDGGGASVTPITAARKAKVSGDR